MFRAALACLFLGAMAKAEERPVIFYTQDERAISGYDVNPAAVREITHALVKAVAGKSDLAEAWRSFVQPSDRVGIKICASGGALFSTHKALVDALADGLILAGVSRANIVVWDRADLAAAGFRAKNGRYSLREIEPARGYDAKALFVSAVMGRLVWGDFAFRRQNGGEEREQLSDESHLSKALMSVTKIINVPVLSSSETCGVAGCIYNAAIPNVDNWRRFTQAPDPALCELYADPRIRGKIVLNLVDGLVAQFAGGPDFQPNYAWSYGTIFAGKDPVALDATALREIETWRGQSKLPAIGPRASYLETAAAMGLGNFAKEKIELRKVSAP